MKLVLKEFWKLSQLGLFGSLLVSGAVSAQTSFYNGGVFTVDRPIDAVNFVNEGSFTSSTFDLFSTRNTRSYYNSGRLSVSLGMEFLTIGDSGLRSPASNIENAQGGIIQGDGDSILSFGFPEGQSYTYGDGGYLIFDAEKILNRGTISASFWGDISFSGQTVDLRRSTVATLSREGTESTRFVYLDPPQIWVANTPGGVANNYWGVALSGVDLAALAVPKVEKETFITATGPLTVSKTNALVTIQFPVSLELDPGTPEANPDRWFGDEITSLGRPVVPALAYVQTNVVNSSNNIIKAIFIINRNPDVLASANIGRGGLSASFGYILTNNTAGNVDFQSLRVNESFTTGPTNLYGRGFTDPSTLVPVTIRVSRLPSETIALTREDRLHLGNEIDPLNKLSRSNLLVKLGEARSGINSSITSDLFTKGYFEGAPAGGLSYTNQISTNDYAAYSFSITSLPSRIPNPTNSSFFSRLLRLPGFPARLASRLQTQNEIGSATNLAGRVRVTSELLNLEDARIRAHGVVNLKANHVLTSTNTSIAAPYVAYDLGSTNGSLVYGGFNPIGQPNLTGSVKVYASYWTNTVEFPVATDTETNIVTGTTSFQMLIVDADFEPLQKSGELVGLKLRATNLTTIDPISISLQDPGTISGGIEGSSAGVRTLGSEQIAPITENWTNSAEIVLSGFIGLGHQTFPKLKNFTNTKSAKVLAEKIVFSNDDQSSLQTFLNQGAIESSGFMSLSAAVFRNEGTLTAGNVFNLSATELALDSISPTNGVAITAGAGLTILADKLSVSAGGLIKATGTLTLDVATHFVAAGGFSSGPNLLSLSASNVRLMRNAVTNNLQGVSVSLKAPRFGRSSLQWAGSDLGLIKSGFTNNSALGALALDVDEFGSIEIASTSGSNGAVYVRQLRLGKGFTYFINTNGIIDPDGLKAALEIRPGMTLYFNSVSVDTNEISGTLLDGQIGGQLRFIPALARGQVGGNIVTDLGGGFSVSAPWSVQYSATLDSDGDGLVNAVDATPFSGALVQTKMVQLQGRPYFEISWAAAVGTRYEIMANDPVAASKWISLSVLQNKSAKSDVLKFYDPVDQGSGARTYRVVYTP